MTDNITLENFLDPPTPEKIALEAAMAEIHDEVGQFKNKTQAEIRSLKRKRRDEHRPDPQASLDRQIAEKERQMVDVDCVYHAARSPVQDHYRGILHWNEIMRKHGVAGY